VQTVCENAAVFDHVEIRASDREASRRFYATVLGSIGQELTHAGEDVDEWNDFGIAQAGSDRPITRGLHVAFVSSSRAQVEAFWRAGTDAGYPSDGEPGLRPQYHEDYYGAFLTDPDGNSAEAVFHGRVRKGEDVIDHLWIRVADLTATRRFYEAIAPSLGLHIRSSSRAERFHVSAGDRSSALVQGGPTTENVHLAFPAPDDETVREFHRTALDAGFRDNGPPGLRLYHPGYYAAFVLDPDGNNVEAVNHNR
jgi:catechol 2,3-dioxygenase-like lactoylglutathione lyase family enzyme